MNINMRTASCSI